MNGVRAAALLVGRGLMNSPKLIEKFGAQEWECHFAESYREAHQHLNTASFALLLSEFYLPDGSAYRLIPCLEGSLITVYFSLQTGATTWWLPAIDRGQLCFGAAALRGAEFGKSLGERLEEAIRLVERDSSAVGPAKDCLDVRIPLALDFPDRARRSRKQANVEDMWHEARPMNIPATASVGRSR